MKIQFIFKWYDFWIGLFYDQKKKYLYFFPIPMLGVVLKFKTKPKFDSNDVKQPWNWKK
jgi:hypothetical protein